MLFLRNPIVLNSLEYCKLINKQRNIRFFGAHIQTKLRGDGIHHDIEWDMALPYKKIPGPSNFTFLRRFMPGGKYHGIELCDINKNLKDEYGEILRFPGIFGIKDFVFLFDPSDYEMVFRAESIYPERRAIETFSYYRKHIRPDVFKGMGGLVTENGKAWFDIRTKANKAMMNPKVVTQYIPAVDKVAQDFISIIKTLLDENNETPAHFGNEINKWALESIGVIALDTRFGILNETEDSEHQRKMIGYVREFFKLSYEFDFLPSIWKYYKSSKFNKLMACYDGMTDIVVNIVERGMKSIQEQSKLYHKAENEQSVLEKMLKHDKHIAVVMAMDMLIAGIDTTGITTVNLLYQLAKNPEKQEKLRKEIFDLLPRKDSPLTRNSLNNIPYMRAALKEGYRITPVIVGNSRAVGSDLVIKGYQVPKGTHCLMVNSLVQLDEKYVPRSKEFIPERWIKNRSNIDNNKYSNLKQTNPFVYLPFGFGARTCIGRRFAEMETQILLMRILREFKIEFHYPDLIYKSYLINMPIGDLKFKFIPLNRDDTTN